MATQQSTPPERSVSAPTLRLYASPSEDRLAQGLLDLFHSVGYAAYSGGTVFTEVDIAAAHVVLTGPDDGQMRAVLDALEEHGRGGATVLIVARPGLSPTGDTRRFRWIEGGGDLYDVFERIAVPLGLDVRTDVFLSYSRRDLAQADFLTQVLLDRGRRPWVDRRDLQPSEEWLQALRQGIEASDSFLFLVSRASVTSPYCLQELGWAVELGKRIIPVLLEPISTDELPEAVRARQWIEVPTDGTLASHVEVIVASLDRDPKIVHLHRQLLLQALEWKRRDGDEGLLLRGSELAEAEDWLGAASIRGEPRPTELHSTFIGASRRAGRLRQRKLWAIAAGVVLLTTSLAVWAVVNALDARKKTDEARSRLAEQRAFGAYVAWDTEPVRAFLLADNAMRTAPDSDPLRPAYTAMTGNLVQQMPETVTNLETGVTVAAFSPDLTKIFVRSSDRKSFIAPLTGRPGKRVALSDAEPFPNYREAQFSFDGKLVAALYRPFFGGEGPYWLIVWRSDTGARLGSVSLEALAGDRPPEIVGFTRDDQFILLQAGGAKRYDGYVLPLKDLASGLHRPAFHSPALFFLGQVDFASSTVVQVDPVETGGGSRLSLLDLATGRPLCAPLFFPQPVRQAFLAQGGRAVAVNEVMEGGTGSRISSWTLSGHLPRPVGRPLTSPFTVVLWGVTSDGSTVAVRTSADSGYPAEIWSLPQGSRVSAPVLERVSTPYIMKAGWEYRPLGFVGDDRWLLVRESLRDPLEGGRIQQLLLFDRATLQLRASPFSLSTSYVALLPAANGVEFVTVSQDGMVEEWNLLRRSLPEPLALAVPGLLLGAVFTDDQTKIVTRSQLRSSEGYAARIDVWDVATGRRLGQLPGTFEVGVKLDVSANGAWIVTASKSQEGGQRVELWDLKTFHRVWSHDGTAPVESISFHRGDARLATVGAGDDGRALLVDYDVQAGNPSPDLLPAIDTGAVHLAFSADGDVLIADYEYNAIALWDLADRQPLGLPLPFSDAAGLPFDLGYDIVRNLKKIRIDGGEITGELPGQVAVALRRDGAGTTIVPISGDAPVLSAFSRDGMNLYPVRGGDLLSPSGRWFTLGTNVTTVDRASALRVYDFLSGFPISDFLLHPAAARPGDPWPRLLTRLESELDPVIGVMFLEDTGHLVTLTTNGLLRRWPILQAHRRQTLWMMPEDIAVGLTGRRLINARSLRRLPQAEFQRLRSVLVPQIQEIRGAAPSLVSTGKDS